VPVGGFYEHCNGFPSLSKNAEIFCNNCREIVSTNLLVDWLVSWLDARYEAREFSDIPGEKC
jgi:hypothetical protein